MHKFHDVMNDYNKVQLGYREKCKERIQRQLEISELMFACLLFSLLSRIIFILRKHIYFYLAGRSVTEGEVEEMLESGNLAVFTQEVSF